MRSLPQQDGTSGKGFKITVKHYIRSRHCRVLNAALPLTRFVILGKFLNLCDLINDMHSVGVQQGQRWVIFSVSSVSPIEEPSDIEQCNIDSGCSGNTFKGNKYL